MDSSFSFLARKEVKLFIKDNMRTDPTSLLLNPPKVFRTNIKLIADQITARRKAKGKLDDWVNNFELIMPPPISIEQASSSSTSDYKKSLISGKYLIDLTGGMGIDCLALSENFDKTVYVEQKEELGRVFNHNCKALNKEIEIRNESAETYLEKNELITRETIIYIDPARRDQNEKRVFRIADCSPDLSELMPLLRKKAKYVLVKYSPFLDLKAITSLLKNIKEIHIISVKNDCKELLLLIDFSYQQKPKIICENIGTGQPSFTYFQKEEKESSAEIGSINRYLFEPNASILKAGAFSKLATDFSLKKLGENTHFYTSDKLVESFPGRIFEVIENASKVSIKKYASNGQINVLSRNHPLSAAELKKKLKLKDGGENFLIAYRDLDHKPKMVITKRPSL